MNNRSNKTILNFQILTTDLKLKALKKTLMYKILVMYKL